MTQIWQGQGLIDINKGLVEKSLYTTSSYNV